jgi:EAL domain-containing protein (putative c-di-GMP-specific phosphodiesterase class I)
VLTALDASFVLDGYSLDVGANVGVVLSPEHGTDPDMLLQRADVALNLAKGSSSRHVLYAPEQDPHSPERLALVADLRRAISQSAEAGELELHYQPKVELATGRLVGAEALLRWRHPQRGLVPPDQVIPMAERTGLIDPLTRCVLNTALRQVRDWQALGLHVPVAVNFSARNLQDADLPQLVAKLLMEHGVPGSQLLAEVTESQLMLDPELALRVLERLRALGVHVSIDDYGTGHSSLTYLNRLPADELKLDRSFIHGVSTNRGTASIVRSTTKLAHDLGLRVVAEGVEDRRSWDLMIQFGCDIVQGYFVSRPLPGPQFAAWAAEWLTRAAVRAA